MTTLVIAAGVVIVIALVKKRALDDDLSVQSAVRDAQHDRDARLRTSASIEPLRARDPALTEESILERVKLMSERVREGWCAGDMKLARPFVSDGVYSRFRTQLALMREEGVRNVMSDARVLYLTIEAVDTKPPVDVVHVRLTAEARDANVAAGATEEEVKAALARAEVVPYTEIWTLLRKHGALTKLEPGQLGRACPGCGAPLEQGAEILKCPYCAALVCSGEHDWVLSEITQLEEWRPEEATDPPGLEKLRQTDLGAARQPLEDRASTLFWGRVTHQRRSGSKQTDVAIGGADLVLVDVAENEEEDHAYVKIFWSARHRPDLEPEPHQHVMRLARRAGTSTRFSMTSMVCMACGAGLKDTTDAKCTRCGAAIDPGREQWRFDQMMPAGAVEPRPRHDPTVAESAAAALLPDIRDPRERVVMFTEMARLMTASGRLERDEKRLLTTCARRWGVDESIVARALSAQLGPTPAEVRPASPEWFVAGLVAAALADGTIDVTEAALLERAAAAAGMPRERLAEIVADYMSRVRSSAA